MLLCDPTLVIPFHLTFVLLLFFDSAHVHSYLFFSSRGVAAQLRMIYLDNPTIPLGE